MFWRVTLEQILSTVQALDLPDEHQRLERLALRRVIRECPPVLQTMVRGEPMIEQQPRGARDAWISRRTPLSDSGANAGNAHGGAQVLSDVEQFLSCVLRFARHALILA
jgi:hypothetical protein